MREDDARRAGYLENLLSDKWSDRKFGGTVYQINACALDQKTRLIGMGAEGRGLSRYLNNK